MLSFTFWKSRRHFIFLLTTCMFLMYFLYGNFLFTFKTNINFDADVQQYQKYQLLHQNPSCPELNISEWNIYKKLTTPNIFVTKDERSKLSLKDLGMVTFVSKSHFVEAFFNCESIRNHSQLKSIPYTIYFSPDVPQNESLKFQKACPNAKIIKFPFEKFPENVQKLEEYRFKVMYEAMTLKNYKIMLNFDTSIQFDKNGDYEEFIKSTVESNPLDVTMLRTTGHTMFPTTHPKTFNCFPNIKPQSTKNIAQFQGGLILWIASEMGWKIMKRFVECSLHPACIAPPGSTKSCKESKIYSNPSKFSGCHRFDQAVINLLLYEHSNFQPNLYQKQSNLFKIVRKA